MHNKSNIVLQGVLDAMQEMLRVLDLSNRVVLTNKSYDSCFGDQLDKRCSEMFGSANRCKTCICQAAMEKGVPQEQIKRNNGRVYSVTASPLQNQDGVAIGAVEVFRDITEQHRQQWQLREQNKRLLSEANFAARMQRDLFLAQGRPDERVSMESRYLPSSSIGGDMFGCIRQNDGRLSFYVADVSGHGIAAAMITLVLANVMRGAQTNSAVEMLNSAREAFLSMTSDDQLYVSMFVAILDPETGELTWANAGLNAVPLLMSREGLERLYSPALPICDWEDEIIYREHKCVMPPDGRLLLYTDGLVDEKSSKLTEEDLEREFSQYEGATLLKRLERQVLPNHDDDVCMLLITRKDLKNTM
ncbi:SpoIIE family protein phosphatase [Eubacteriales bacterium OttesenSCG-928-K08]|nr:SpoIIE family protein phosphatase [Eubacteriales bacterium OttesenSCG-928-K08]